MHPLFNSSWKLLILLLVWLAYVVGICQLLVLTGDGSLPDNLLLFLPLYLLVLLFVLPNYYVCRGLPLGESSPLMLLMSHGLALVVVLGLWLLIGESYAGLLVNMTSEQHWPGLFSAAFYVNVGFILLQVTLFILLHYLYFALEKSRHLEKAALQQKLLISQAELHTLRATVHPHFLFNSLNTLSTITLSDPDRAHRFCQLLADFLRYSVAYSKKDLVSFGEEVEHIQNYLGIERERFGDRLQTEFDIAGQLLEVKQPPLILFPLIENAIKHGIDSLIEGGTLRLQARENNNSLLITISNPLDELGRKARGTGHGLASVERRLKNRYGEQARLVSEKQDGLYTVKLYLPLQGEASAETDNP